MVARQDKLFGVLEKQKRLLGSEILKQAGWVIRNQQPSSSTLWCRVAPYLLFTFLGSTGFLLFADSQNDQGRLIGLLIIVAAIPLQAISYKAAQRSNSNFYHNLGSFFFGIMGPIVSTFIPLPLLLRVGLFVVFIVIAISIESGSVFCRRMWHVMLFLCTVAAVTLLASGIAANPLKSWVLSIAYVLFSAFVAYRMIRPPDPIPLAGGVVAGLVRPEAERVEKTIPSEYELIKEYNSAIKGTVEDREHFFEKYEFRILLLNNPDLAQKGAGARLTGDVLFDESNAGDLFRLIKTTSDWRLVPTFRIRFDSVGIVRFAFDYKEQPTRNGEGYCRIGELFRLAKLCQKGEKQWVLVERGTISFEKPGSQPRNTPKNSTQGSSTDTSRSAAESLTERLSAVQTLTGGWVQDLVDCLIGIEANAKRGVTCLEKKDLPAARLFLSIVDQELSNCRLWIEDSFSALMTQINSNAPLLRPLERESAEITGLPKATAEATRWIQDLVGCLLGIEAEAKRGINCLDKEDIPYAGYCLGVIGHKLSTCRLLIENSRPAIIAHLNSHVRLSRPLERTEGRGQAKTTIVEKIIPSEHDLIQDYNKVLKEKDADRERFFERYEFKILRFNNPDLAGKGAGAGLTGEWLFDEAEAGEQFRLVKTKSDWQLVPMFRIPSGDHWFVRMAFAYRDEPRKSGGKSDQIGKLIQPAKMKQKGEKQWALEKWGAISFVPSQEPLVVPALSPVILGLVGPTSSSQLAQELRKALTDIGEVLQATLHRIDEKESVGAHEAVKAVRQRVLDCSHAIHTLEEMTKHAAAQKREKSKESEKSIIERNSHDMLLPEATELVIRHKQSSVSLLQRRLGIGYQRAAHLMDQLEATGIVGPYDGSKAREVLVDRSYLEKLRKDTSRGDEAAMPPGSKTASETPVQYRDIMERLLEIEEESRRLRNRINENDSISALLSAKVIGQMAVNCRCGMNELLVASKRIDSSDSQTAPPKSFEAVEELLKHETPPKPKLKQSVLITEYNKAVDSEPEVQELFNGKHGCRVVLRIPFTDDEPDSPGFCYELSGQGDTFWLAVVDSGPKLIPQFRVPKEKGFLISEAFEYKSKREDQPGWKYRVTEMSVPASLRPVPNTENRWFLEKRGTISVEQSK